MPMIPSGRVDVATLERPKKIAENVELAVAPPETSQAPEIDPGDDYLVLNPDGSINNRETTNRIAREVSALLGQDINVEDPTFCAGIVVMIGNRLNFRFGRVSDFTGLPRRFCQKVINNLGYSHLLFKRQLCGPLVEAVEENDETVPWQFLFCLYCVAGSGQIRMDRDERWSAMPPEDKTFYEIESVKGW